MLITSQQITSLHHDVILVLFLTEIKSREERSRQYFDTDLMLGDHCDEEDELYDRVGVQSAYTCGPLASAYVLGVMP